MRFSLPAPHSSAWDPYDHLHKKKFSCLELCTPFQSIGEVGLNPSFQHKSDCEAKSLVFEVDSFAHPGSEISFLQSSSFNDSPEIEFFFNAECSQRLGLIAIFRTFHCSSIFKLTAGLDYLLRLLLRFVLKAKLKSGFLLSNLELGA
ncbi:hypothetical protein S245_071575, partial [Arachis hypogaea]